MHNRIHGVHCVTNVILDVGMKFEKKLRDFGSLITVNVISKT